MKLAKSVLSQAVSCEFPSEGGIRAEAIPKKERPFYGESSGRFDLIPVKLGGNFIRRFSRKSAGGVAFGLRHGELTVK